MQLAVNWSPEAAELLNEGKIQLDLYKCPDWQELVADAQTQKPAYIHFPIGIGRGQMPLWNFADIHNWLEKSETRFVNSHIIPHKDCFPENIALDDLISELAKEVQALVDEFGAERVIIENCPDFIGNYEKGYLAQGVEPTLFHALIAETGCGFLLDISHAHMTCDFTGRDFEAYINALPVQQIRELHVTGMGKWSTGLIGDHMPMTDSDWQRLEYCVGKILAGDWRLPEVMAFEYGGIAKLKELCGSDKDAIARDVPRLYAITEKLNKQVVSHNL